MEANAIRMSAAALFVICQVCHADPAGTQQPMFAFAAPGVEAAALSGTAQAASGCAGAIVIRLPAALGGSGGAGAIVQPAPASSGCALSLDGIELASTRPHDEAPVAFAASGASAALRQAPAVASHIVTDSESVDERAADASATSAPEQSGDSRTAVAPSTSPVPPSAARDAGGAPHLMPALFGALADMLSARINPRLLQEVVVAVLVCVIALSSAVFVVVMTIVLRKHYFTPRAVVARAAARGLKRGQFYLEYQPVLHVRSRQCYGVEVLLRWRDSVHGRRGADWFMAQMENSPVVARLLRFVLELASADLGGTEAGRALQIIVNIPAACIADHGHAALIAQLAKSLSTQRVVLQVSCEALRSARDNVRYLHDEGVRVSLCDVRSPADTAGIAPTGALQFAKLHREIMTLGEGLRSQTLSGFSAWGREYGIPVIADGIEAIGQYHAAGRAQIGLAQGFFLCKALDPGRLLLFLDRLKAMQSLHPSSLPRTA